MFVVDTNILVYAANEDSPLHPGCKEALESWRRSPSAWYVTWGILYEWMAVVTHPRALSRPWEPEAAFDFVEALLASPGLGVLVPGERHAAVAAEVNASVPHLRGNLWHDAETAILMRERGIRRIYTRDTDFHRFPVLEVVDPI